MSAQDESSIFEFHRNIDDLAYRFEPAQLRNGKASWRRTDLPLDLLWTEKWGWIVTDEEGALLSRPWEIEKDAQGSLPPKGVWVSRKGSKSYVYDLRRIAASTSA